MIPTLNEEKGIENSIKAVPMGELQGSFNVEVIVVDGYSNDHTVEIAKSVGAKVIMEKRKGYGRAYKTGFDAAKGDLLIALDGDATYPASRIPEFLQLMANLDFLTTNRFAKIKKEAMSFRNRLGNGVLSFTARFLYGFPFHDSQSGMWVIRKSAWEKVRDKIKSDGMAFSQEIKIEFWRNGFRCLEAPIEYNERKGKAKLNPWKDGAKNFLHLFQKKIS